MVASTLLALSAAWAAARLCGDLCARFRQPRVVGEILAGVLARTRQQDTAVL